MKVCIVGGESRRGVGGLAAYMRGLARELTKAGHTVTTVARFDRDLPEPLDYAAGRTGSGEIVDGLPTRLVGPVPWARLWLPRLRHFTSRRLLRSWAPRLFALAYRQGLEAAIPDDVEVIHYVGTGWELLGFTAMRVARQRGATFTVWPAVHAGTWGDSPLDIALYSRADAVFCQSNHELQHLAALGVGSNRLVRCSLAPAAPASGNGQRFRERHKIGDRPLILFIARKSRLKGYHTLCEAMPAVLATAPSAYLVTIGPEGEPPYPSVPAGALLDLGPVDDAVKADALAACDVFCMPSAAESFGIVYVEAWSYGKPVIGGPAPAVRELIEDGISGYVVEQSADAVAASLVLLFANRPLRERLGTAGRELQRRRYTWPAVTELHVRVFELACQSKQKF